MIKTCQMKRRTPSTLETPHDLLHAADRTVTADAWARTSGMSLGAAGGLHKV
jgi:hypothetical protein